MSIIELASMQEAVDYEIERVETNSKWSLSMHNQLETRASEFPEDQEFSEDQEVVTGYPETIAPLVMDSPHLRCATPAITDKTVFSIPENIDTKYEDGEITSSTAGHLQNASANIKKSRISEWNNK